MKAFAEIIVGIVLILATASAQNLTVKFSPTRIPFRGYAQDGRMTWYVSSTKGSVEFSWNSETGKTYRVEMKNDLTPNHVSTNGVRYGQAWTPSSPSLIGTGAEMKFTNGALNQGFYRIQTN